MGMSYLIPLLIVTASAVAQTASSDTEASRVFACDFEADSDLNFDAWPDHWTRRAGRGFPHYLKVAIQKDASKNHCLRIELDGGAATLYSPATVVSPRFSYVVEADLKVEQLRYDVAYVSVVLYNEAGDRLETFSSAKHKRLRNWTKVRIGPITPTDPETSSAIIELHLEPTGRKTDLVGAAQFDNVEMTRLPRMALTSNRIHNVYTSPRDVEITCEVSGVLDLDRQITLELLDVHSQVLDTQRQPLQARRGESTTRNDRGSAGSVIWQPRIEQNGFYRVRAKMQGESGGSLKREVSFVVISEHSVLESGDFGWSLPQGENPMSTKRLAGLLRHVGINWVKFPVWDSDLEITWADRIAEFAERLKENKIQFIGVLDQPPKEARAYFGKGDRIPVATIFVDPELWQPVVDPVMSRLALYVRWWQIGSDDDTSFVGFPDLKSRVTEIKQHLEKFGQEIELGIPWNWLYESPQSDSDAWEFLSLTEHPPFTRHELKTYLAGDTNHSSRRWVSLKPLARSQYALDDRVQDLVTRILSAKLGGADGIFMPTPFDREHGLMNTDGTPGELLLPWRTVALQISGKEFLGSIRLPSGSENYILADEKEAVMIVWNDRPTKETVFLGHDVRQIDVWGHSTKPLKDGHRQVIAVGRIPAIVTGLNRAVAQWRMEFEFDERPLASVFGQPQTTSLRFTNSFGQGVGGRLQLDTPDDWETQEEFDVKMPADGKVQTFFDIVLNSVARTGVQPVRADFDITADRSYRFSVYRTLQVGRGDVVIDVQARIDENGNLVVTQQLENRTDRFISFDCLLFAPNHRRQRIQVINLGRGRNSQTYYLPKGKDLIGKQLWLRAEEINGSRVLNYHVTVGE